MSILDSRNYIIMQVIHGIIRPTTALLLKQPGTSQKKTWKPTIAASQESFCTISNAAAAKTKIQERDTKYKEMGMTNQTYIMAIGEDKFAIEYFLVILDGIIYRLDNMVKAIDVAFKMQFVLGIEYARECVLVWLFIQNYFYNINLNTDKKSTSVSCLIREIL